MGTRSEAFANFFPVPKGEWGLHSIVPRPLSPFLFWRGMRSRAISSPFLNLFKLRGKNFTLFAPPPLGEGKSIANYFGYSLRFPYPPSPLGNGGGELLCFPLPANAVFTIPQRGRGTKLRSSINQGEGGKQLGTMRESNRRNEQREMVPKGESGGTSVASYIFFF